MPVEKSKFIQMVEAMTGEFTDKSIRETEKVVDQFIKLKIMWEFRKDGIDYIDMTKLGKQCQQAGLFKETKLST